MQAPHTFTDMHLRCSTFLAMPPATLLLPTVPLNTCFVRRSFQNEKLPASKQWMIPVNCPQQPDPFRPTTVILARTTTTINPS
ncbi:molybdopterin biosynthesis protein [Anopheles sinensis]|uniref:Molybdopterin biosynthesis protein n=1 Tax=Anopheles sinensis TaxID=74873 RepID=A0A084WHA6_ANOSI|nr:molybdopterin biosynthesis protein [Anopheles sinensis]